MKTKKMKHDVQELKESEITEVLGRSLVTGFIGGIIWSSIATFMYYFNLSEVSVRAFMLRPWIQAEWINRWPGDVLSIILVGFLSVLVALIYFMLFKKMNIISIGLLYGLLLWFLVFYVFQSIFVNVPKLDDLHYNTIISTICVYALYGTFIGYSISYDYYDTSLKKMKSSQL